MKFEIDPAIFAAFPGLHIGVVCVKGMDNHGDCPAIQEQINETQRKIRNNFDQESLAQFPKIQSWRNAYTLFGAKPKKHLSSVENLYRMTLEEKDIRSINKLVDIYNCVSLLHMVPVGGDDLAKVDGDILLRFANGDEAFFPLGSCELQKARKGEVIYADAKEVLCRRWNWRECEKTKMTEETQDVLLVSEGLPPVMAGEIMETATDLSRLVEKYCGGRINHELLSAEKNIWEL